MESALTIPTLLTTIIWAAAAAATGPYREALFRITNNNDVTEGVDALFESVAYSRSSCAVLCVARPDCHGLKFVPGVSATSPGKCFGYAVDKECRSSHRRSKRVTSTCPQLDMGGAYLQYNKTDPDAIPGAAITITDYIELSLCQCLADCVNHASDCRAVVFTPQSGTSTSGNNCYLLGHFTVNDAPAWYAWTMYKRNCV